MNIHIHDGKHGILYFVIDVVAYTPTLETEDITMAARKSRDKKEVTRFAPEKAVEKKEPKDLLYEVGYYSINLLSDFAAMATGHYMISAAGHVPDYSLSIDCESSC